MISKLDIERYKFHLFIGHVMKYYQIKWCSFDFGVAHPCSLHKSGNHYYNVHKAGGRFTKKF